MVTERSLINALIIGATLILIPFGISMTLSYYFQPALILVAALAFIFSFFYIKENLSVCPMLGFAIFGTLNFLPIPLQAPHVFCILLILYFLTGYVIIRQKKIKLGYPTLLWPIAIVTLIVLYHNHGLNVKLLGGGATEGEKPAILMFLVVIAYFCGINLRPPSIFILSYLPIICLVLAMVTNLPFFLTTYIPGLAPFLYMFTDNVNVQAYSDSAFGAEGSSTSARMGTLGAIGSAVQICLLCYYPIGTWWRPERWWVLGLFFAALVLAVLTGFRSTLFGFFTVTFVGACCYYSWRALFAFGGLFIILAMAQLLVANGVLRIPEDKLPLIAQRSLSFMPGDWDKQAVEGAEVSNGFRKNIQAVYIKEYLSKSPLFGNGYDIDKKVFDNYSDQLQRGGGVDPQYTEAKTYIEGKIFHTGWISVYDCVGIVGTIAFVALAWNETLMAGRFIFGPKSNRRSSFFPLYVFILVNVVSSTIGFFAVFGDFAVSFSALCIYGIVLSQLADIEKATSAPEPLTSPKGDVDFSRVGGGYYGYPTKS